jgi:hypothetical protein
MLDSPPTALTRLTSSTMSCAKARPASPHKSKRGEAFFNLSGGVEAFKCVFSSFCHILLSDTYKKSLSVNVNVANGDLLQIYFLPAW